CPQFVTCIRDERTFAVEGGLKPSEHLVQPSAQTRDLIVGARERQPPTRVRTRDGRSLAAHPLDGAERGRGQKVSREGSKQQCRGPADQQLAPQTGKRLGSLLE